MYGADPVAAAAYYRLMNFNGAAQVYHIARDVGIYDSLAEGPRTAEQLAEATTLKVESTRLLLAALEALGLVEPTDANYSLAPVAQMLIHGPYRELGNQYWRHLPTFLAAGEPLARIDTTDQSESFYQAQAALLGWMLAPIARTAAEMLDFGKTRRGLHILDLGAGSAVWSIAFAAQDSATRVTAVDWPAVLEVAKETAHEFEMLDRLETVPGNLHDIELPNKKFDFAIVANVTHLETLQGNESIFRTAAAALKDAGEILIIDVLPGDPQGDLPRALYALGRALRTDHGRVYTPEELSAMLERTGFSEARVLPVRVPPHTIGMVLARKSTKA